MKNLIDWPNYPSDTTKMKTHHELECPTLDKIQEEVMLWVDTNTNYLSDKTDTGFWHLIDDVDMARHCPNLIKYMMSLKIPLRQISVGVLTESMKDHGFSLHMGNPPLNIKINFPIYNTEDVYTEWYDIPVDDLDELGIVKNPHVTDFDAFNYDLPKIHHVVQDLYPCITRYNMHKHPIVFNSWIPHRVMPGPNAKYPRIMVACMPIKEPTHYLEK
jgi:hypothetical protein